MIRQICNIARIATLLMAICTPTMAAELSGQVFLPNGQPAKEAVISLKGGLTAAPLPNVTVDQRNKAFIPHVSVVTQGTKVRFPNNDTVFHNVFAYYQAKKFDLGMYPRGASKTVTFDKPGLVALLCNVHSEMSAYIMVVDTPYYAITDTHGRFHIAHLETGNYVLHGWHETGAKAARSIAVAAGQPSITIHMQK